MLSADAGKPGKHRRMMACLKDGQAIPKVIAWAQDEPEGFARCGKFG